MNCVRALEANQNDVAALLPMLLEVYFTQVDDVIEKAIARHRESCTGDSIDNPPHAFAKHAWLITFLSRLGWPGVIIVAIIRCEEIMAAIAPLFQ